MYNIRRMKHIHVYSLLNIRKDGMVEFHHHQLFQLICDTWIKYIKMCIIIAHNSCVIRKWNRTYLYVPAAATRLLIQHWAHYAFCPPIIVIFWKYCLLLSCSCEIRSCEILISHSKDQYFSEYKYRGINQTKSDWILSNFIHLTRLAHLIRFSLILPNA